MSAAPKVQRLFVIRHGESVANVDGAHRKDMPDHLISLTPRGWQQAQDCGTFLAHYLEQGGNPANRRFALWHSSFLRTRQTAKGIFESIEKFKPRVYERDAIVEISFGYNDGLTDEEAAEQFPAYAALRKRDLRQDTRHFVRAPNGEARSDVSYRARHFIDSVKRKAEEYGITDHIIVSHAITGRIFIKEWLNLPYETVDAEKSPDNCDIRLIARNANNVGYSDCGYIYRHGRPKDPAPAPHISALERMKSDEFIPSFARETNSTGT